MILKIRKKVHETSFQIEWLSMGRGGWGRRGVVVHGEGSSWLFMVWIPQAGWLFISEKKVKRTVADIDWWERTGVRKIMLPCINFNAVINSYARDTITLPPATCHLPAIQIKRKRSPFYAETLRIYTLIWIVIHVKITLNGDGKYYTDMTIIKHISKIFKR